MRTSPRTSGTAVLMLLTIAAALPTAVAAENASLAADLRKRTRPRASCRYPTGVPFPQADKRAAWQQLPSDARDKS